MNNWGQQPPGQGQAYDGHGYQQMAAQPGYPQHQQHQPQQLQQQQFQQQQQQQQQQQHSHQQQQYGTGNSMAYMGNQQYQAGAHFLPAPAQHSQMQPMPQYGHAQVHPQAHQAHANPAAMNSFHPQQQHHQQQQRQPHQQHQQQPFSNGAYQHHAPVPQLQPQPQPQPQLQPHPQYMSHHNYQPQVATPSPRPIQQRIPSQSAQPLQQPLQPQPQPQQPSMPKPQLIPQKRRPAQQLQSPRVNSPHMPPGQLQSAQQLQSPRVSSPHAQPGQLQAAQPYQSPRVSGAHMPAAKPPLPQQLQSPRVATSHIPSPRLQPAPSLQSPRVNNQQVPAAHSQPAPSVQTPHKVESPVLPPAQTQTALQQQQPLERKQPAPAIQPQPQRHVSDGIDPTQLMLKREPPAPARKSLPAPAITRSPSISTKSPSMSNVQTPASHFDTPAVLTCVADDCFQTAHAAVHDIATSLDKQRVDEYYKLIATGLGCLDAALNLNKLPPRSEANIRLRYATALSEETDNLMEAETALTKGIAVCEKNRFTDLKYCMQFQLLKVLFRRNRKAAFVEIDKNIQDAITYKAADWVYAFRFLKASLHLQSSNPADAQALDNLRNITQLANSRGDLAIAVLSSLLEGIVHLKARKEDSIVRVQTCIAQASRYQLDPSVQIPQVEVLTLLLDLACTLQQKAPQIAMQKLKALQARMDELVQAHDWDKMLDVLHLPLKRQPNSSASVTGDTKTIILPGDGEHNFIVLSFVTKVHAFVLAYVLSGLALLYQGAKSEKIMEYWSEALNMLGKTPAHARPPAHSLPMAIEQARWQAEVKRYVYALIALISATRTQWSRVHDCIQKIEALSPKPEGGRLGLLVLYVTGVYYQGTGDIERALQIFGDQRFAIPAAGTDDRNTGTPPPEVALLAAMNKIWIMQDLSYRNDEELTELIEKITPYCSDHADVDIRTAFNLMQAALQTEPRQSMQTVKKHIQVGLKWAQGANNTQLLAVALNLMRSVLFENVVGDQAVKSAKAGRQQAHKAGNLLWMSVADGMLAQTEEMQGQVDEAERLRQDGMRFANQAFAKPDED